MSQMPELNRPESLYRQIAERYKRRIISGEMASKDPFPSVRVIAREWNVAPNVAQRAIDHLKAEGLVFTVPNKGTFVNGHRAKYGPQQRMRSAEFPGTERVEIRAAEVIPAPAYVVPLLGLRPEADGVTRVIRREWLTYENGDVPFMLSVSWCAAQAAGVVPELLALTPLPSPAGAAKMIAERTGRKVTWGHLWREARHIKDDGREGPLLRLPKGATCLAETYTWSSAGDVLEYGEYAVVLDRVIENDMEA
jgi:GntR family transcriptional regulator